MGLFPAWSKEQTLAFEIKRKHQDSVIAANGFKQLKGWFGKLCEEFFSKYRYAACYEKDGKIYAWIQVVVLLGLEYTDDDDISIKQRKKWKEMPPVEAAPWLERKEVLKKELGIDYDAHPPL